MTGSMVLEPVGTDTGIGSPPIRGEPVGTGNRCRVFGCLRGKVKPLGTHPYAAQGDVPSKRIER